MQFFQKVWLFFEVSVGLKPLRALPLEIRKNETGIWTQVRVNVIIFQYFKRKLWENPYFPSKFCIIVSTWFQLKHSWRLFLNSTCMFFFLFRYYATKNLTNTWDFCNSFQNYKSFAFFSKNFELFAIFFQKFEFFEVTVGFSIVSGSQNTVSIRKII